MGQLYNRVRETATTTGTGSLTLAGAASGYHSFNDKVPTGTTVRYVIAHQSANEFEYGLGTFTATATLARTKVLGGSNGTSLVNLSAGTKDVWVDALAEDIGPITGRISGRRYLGTFLTLGSNGAPTINVLYAFPFWVGPTTTFDGIAFAALGTASSFLRVGLYADNNGRPDALIVDAGQVDCAVGGEKVASITQTLSNLAWIAGVPQGVSPSVTRAGLVMSPYTGCSSAYSEGGGMGYSQTGITGALPSPWGSTYTPVITASVAPLLYLKVA